MRKSILTTVMITLGMGVICLHAQDNEASNKKFQEVLDAHGRLAKWQSYNSAKFDLRDWPTGPETPD